MCHGLPASAAISRSRATMTSSASVRVLAVRDEDVLQVGGVAGGVAEDARVARGRPVVAECDAAGVGEKVIRRELASRAPLGERADRVDAREPRGVGAPHDLRDDRRRVERRLGVRHARDGGEPARDGRRRPGRDRLLLRLPRFAQVDVHVDEARRHDRVRRVNDPRVVFVDVLGDRDDEPVFDQDVAIRVDPLHRIDDPSAFNQRSHAAIGAPLTSRSRTAMRTKTPLCTCST
jgi:hypothetical protein